jgi:hypothetical protein
LRAAPNPSVIGIGLGPPFVRRRILEDRAVQREDRRVALAHLLGDDPLAPAQVVRGQVHGFAQARDLARHFLFGH